MAEQRLGATLETRLNNLSCYVNVEDKAYNLMCLFKVENMETWYWSLRAGAAPGVDRVTHDQYGRELEANLQNLEQRMRKWSYRPQPTRRAYIPKGENSLRPLGIPATEDKVVQTGMAQILNAIYEPHFLECSYGFRPERNCHDALRALDVAIMQRPTNHIIDADIKGYFDHVQHDWLIRMLEEHIGDKQFLRLVKRFLKAGVIDDGKWRATEEGTPQGGVISPVLSNVFLHYVLDLWVEKVVKPRCQGYVQLIRYADDFVICTQRQNDAKRIYEALGKRLNKFGLELSEEKTRVIPFGRYAQKNARRRGQRPATFDFLGFTHYNAQTRKGAYKKGIRTIRKRFTKKLAEIKAWIKKTRYRRKLPEWWPILGRKLRGYYQYYGVSGNYDRIRAFHQQVLRLAAKWVSRMSQKRLRALKNFWNYVKRCPLPPPKIYVNLYAFGLRRE